MSVVTAAARVNGCMTRNMGNEKELPLDSMEMKGILAYYDWLAEGSKKDEAMEGTGLQSLNYQTEKPMLPTGKKSINKHVPAVTATKRSV